jgi:hypothetical protein
MWIQIIILFISLLVLPGYFIYELWKGQDTSKFKWLIKAAYSSAFLLYIFLAGRWDWLSYYLRFVWIGLLVLALVISSRRIQALPFFANHGQSLWQSMIGDGFTLLLFLSFLIVTVRGYFHTEEPVCLRFPLRDGRYYIAQGGNSQLINYHNRNRSQRYALDIVALNRAGIRALGIYPSDINKYVIFNSNVYSPCEGIIIEAVDGLPDQVPPETDREHLAGNHVVVQCQNVSVLLAHLQNGSVAVQVGDRVTTDQVLGRIGNSGNTTEPHLHIHAVHGNPVNVLEGEGVPILFGEKFLVRNTLLTE